MMTQIIFCGVRFRIELRAALMVSTALTASVLLATPVHAANWTGATGDWFDPTNWNSGVPTSGAQANINNGGTAEIGADGAAASSIWIGQNAGQSGALEVIGSDSELTASSGVFVGFSGSGTLDISEGGVVNSGGTSIGATTNGSGSVTVDGDGSAFNNAGLTVGGDGEGTLDITNGGYVFSTSGSIGSGSGSGHVTIDGEGSSWQNLYTLYVGYSGEAMLDISNGGAASSQGAYVGFQSGSTGAVTVDGEGSLLTDSGTFYLGYEGEGSLTVANGASAGFVWLSIAELAGSTGIVNIGAAAGDAAVAAGTLDVGTIVFGEGTGEIVFNHTDTDYLLASNISGAGALRFLDGVTTLSGDSSTFSGTTTVEAGMLIVNGSLGGSMSVGAARLGGSGTIANVSLGSGSVIAPGNSVGTLTVMGDITFHAGSTYEVEVDPASTDNDLIHVTGTAYLNGASVEHIGLSGTYPWYLTRTILTADGGIDGTFGSITSDFAFLTPDLAYDANNVRMTLLRNDVDFTEVTTTPNQTGVAGATNTLGIGNPIYDQILLMTEDEARAAFNALSGEAYGSTDSAAVSSVQQIRNVLQARLQMFAGGALKSSGGVQVAALGDFMPSADTLSSDRPAVWGQVFGSWGVNDESVNVAKLERRSAGFLGGADKSVGEASRVGVALGYSHSNFDVSARSSSGDSDNFHVAGYAGTKLGIVDLGSTLSYSYGRSEAERTVIVGLLTNNLSADYDTHTFQASVEAATDIDMSAVVVTPFAGLAVTHARADGFTETGGPAALTVSASDNTTGVSSLGLRLRRETGKVALSGSLAWRHAFGDVDPGSRVAFASAPASSFLVRGAPVSDDALAVGSYLGLELTDRTTLTLGYDGEFASDVRDHSLKAEVRVEF
ncbi:MAG: autotransporter domain-containing protein [Parvibaculum sp.]|nr:autotransporter domain-containing protein [Parvibaculum sp.]